MTPSMSKQLVSAVIPTFNYAQFVPGAVESVLGQTYGHCEVIVVDDGSTDDTRTRLQPFMDRIRYVYQPNAGLSAARNRGIAEARGEFVGLLDSDDRWHPRFLEFIVQGFERVPALDLLGSRSHMGINDVRPETLPPNPAIEDVPLEAVLTRHPLNASSVVARRGVFDRAGGFDTSLRSVEDRDMWIRIALQGRLGCLDAILTWVRVHSASMSSATNTERMEHFDKLVLERAFLQPALTARRALRRQALSMASWKAAVAYRENRDFRRAWARALTGLWHWPLPYVGVPRASGKAFRMRFLASLSRDQLRSVVQPKSRFGRSPAVTSSEPS